MAWNQNLTHLRDWFAERYFTPNESRAVVVQAGLDAKFITFDGQSITNWFNILTYANNQRMVHELIDVAVDQYPKEKDWLLSAKAGALTGISGVDIKTAVTWQGDDDADTLEKIIGDRNSLLPIHFLDLGAKIARAVVRIKLPKGSGSGFLIDNSLLITNHHVIENESVAEQAKMQCNYQMTTASLNASVEEYSLVPAEGFATSRTDDWTAVRVQGNPNEKWGSLSLSQTDPKKGDWLNIIQHPQGGPKQIALYDNPIVFVDENRVQYLTDTLPGSSGSPCFDSEWNVVALHHSGGWLKEPGTKDRYYRNEGIHVNRVIAGLVEVGLVDVDL